MISIFTTTKKKHLRKQNKRMIQKIQENYNIIIHVTFYQIKNIITFYLSFIGTRFYILYNISIINLNRYFFKLDDFNKKMLLKFDKTIEKSIFL